jgi:hypothetical protein
VVVSGVPTVSGADRGVDGVQQISANSRAWSTRTGASWSEAEERLDRPRTEMASGCHPVRRFSAREGREKDQGGALGEEEEDRVKKEARDSPSTSESSGEACKDGGYLTSDFVD